MKEDVKLDISTSIADHLMILVQWKFENALVKYFIHQVFHTCLFQNAIFSGFGLVFFTHKEQYLDLAALFF